MGIGDHLPRNGQYELFTHNGKTYSFDDRDIDMPAVVNAPSEMFEWLRSQPGCLSLDNFDNTAFYLTPKTYLLWKLRWT
jgi:hypothetical protein